MSTLYIGIMIALSFMLGMTTEEILKLKTEDPQRYEDAIKQLQEEQPSIEIIKKEDIMVGDLEG